jgi:hypothetical protein
MQFEVFEAKASNWTEVKFEKWLFTLQTGYEWYQDMAGYLIRTKQHNEHFQPVILKMHLNTKFQLVLHKQPHFQNSRWYLKLLNLKRYFQTLDFKLQTSTPRQPCKKIPGACRVPCA